LCLHALKGCEVVLLVTTTAKAWRRFRPGEGRERAGAVAFFDRRIAFLDAGVPVTGNAYEQMALYWGPRTARFREVFQEVAWCP
jgi:hypothetical protein